MPFFSIMMPAYNAEKYLTESLDSVLVQTYSDYELVVVDDCSTDSTYEILQDYACKDSRIKLFRNQKNLGSCRTRRFALENMSGKFAAFLDSDDIWEQDKLEIFAETIRMHAAKSLCVHSDAKLIDAAGSEIGESFQERFNRKGNPVSGNIFDYILTSNWINMSSAVVDMTTLRQSGGFRELDNMVTDDWDMWVRFAQYAEFVYIDRKLTQYRLHAEGISAPQQVQRVALAREQVFANIMALYSHSLPERRLGQVCYLRAANAAVLGWKWLARKYFFEAWVKNKLNFKALIRTVLGR